MIFQIELKPKGHRRILSPDDGRGRAGRDLLQGWEIAASLASKHRPPTEDGPEIEYRIYDDELRLLLTGRRSFSMLFL